MIDPLAIIDGRFREPLVLAMSGSSGGGRDNRILLDHWNFKSENPLIGVNGGEATGSTLHMTFDANGVTFNNTSCYISMPGFFTTYGLNSAETLDIVVKFATLQCEAGGNHKRCMMYNTSSGLIYRSTGYWGVYSGSWKMSEIADGNALNGCKVTLRGNYSKNVPWKIYRNDVLWIESTAVPNISAFQIGSNEQSLPIGTVIEYMSLYQVVTP